MPMENKNRTHLLILLGLIAVTLIAYWPVQRFDFVIFDDPIYTADNAHIAPGITWDSVRWAFAFNGAGYWQPLTWVSHMVDQAVFGAQPGPQHLVNLAVHVINVLLLFQFLYLATGACWRSAMVAALFALHPLNVESVAWISSRKNLLSTCFWMLTLLAYVHYSRRPMLLRYSLVGIVMACGLMAKPMATTLPIVLLLLDLWPLNRIAEYPTEREHLDHDPATFPNRSQQLPLSRILYEKFGLLIISAISIGLTLASMGTIQSSFLAPMPALSLRLANAIVTPFRYVEKLLWPRDLAFFYPFPEAIPLWQSVSAGIALLAITAGGVLAWRRRPYLLIGWLWFLITLAPVSGLTPVRLWPSMADRFSYVPAIGLFIIASWSVADILERTSFRKGAAIGIAVALVGLMAWGTRSQTRTWENSVALCQNALNVTADNWLAHTQMGTVLQGTGELSNAIWHFREAIRITPVNLDAMNNLALALSESNRHSEATRHFETIIRLKPENGSFHYNFGMHLLRNGDRQRALTHLQASARYRPEYAPVWNILGIAAAQDGELDQARVYFLRALEKDPEYTDARTNLAQLKHLSAAEGIHQENPSFHL